MRTFITGVALFLLFFYYPEPKFGLMAIIIAPLLVIGSFLAIAQDIKELIKE